MVAMSDLPSCDAFAREDGERAPSHCRCNNLAPQDVSSSSGAVREQMATSPDRDTADRFRAVAERELARLYATARRLVGDDAEDVVQETLLRAYKSFLQLVDEDAAGAWLTSILVNCCRDHWRALGRRVQEVELGDVEEFSLFRTIADEDPFPYSDSVHLDFLQQFGTEDVRAVLASLPEMYRVPLVLVHMAGYHVKEVAYMLHVPLGTMLARLHRGRKLFERELWTYAERNGLLKEAARP
jgi:RNA polymerase sigma-70 factor (ECF subfamily)